MYCYFLCDVPCALKVDGAFLGVTSHNLRYVESERCFLEFIPLDESFENVSFLFDKNHPVSTKNTKIIDLYGGFLIIPQFYRKSDGRFTLLGKKSFDFTYPTLVTCFSQNGVKLCVSKQNDFLIEELPFTPKDIIFDTCRTYGNEYLLAVCIADKTEILAFKIGEKISLVFKNVCDGYSLNKNTLTVFEKKNDLLKHSISCTWQFGETVTLKNYKITCEREVFSLPEKLLVIAFFEELLLDGDVEAFLSPELKPRSSEMKEFIGKFTRILPPPHFVSSDLVTLLYDDKVEYAQVAVTNGLITNVTLI